MMSSVISVDESPTRGHRYSRIYFRPIRKLSTGASSLPESDEQPIDAKRISGSKEMGGCRVGRSESEMEIDMLLLCKSAEGERGKFEALGKRISPSAARPT